LVQHVLAYVCHVCVGAYTPGGLLRKPPLKCAQGCWRRSTRRSISANTSLRRSITTLCRVGLAARIMRRAAPIHALVRRLAREFRMWSSAAYLPLMSHFWRCLQYNLYWKPEKNANFLQFFAQPTSAYMSRICPMKMGKNPVFPLFSAIFSKKLQFFAKKCQFLCNLIWVLCAHICHDLAWKRWISSIFSDFLQKIEKNCNFLHTCVSSARCIPAVYLPWNCPKFTKIGVFQPFFWKKFNFLQFFAIFVQSWNLYISHFLSDFSSNCIVFAKKMPIFCTSGSTCESTYVPWNEAFPIQIVLKNLKK